LLLSEQAIDDNAYIVLNGTVRVYVMIGEKEQNIRFAYSGEIFTHMDSFFQDIPSQYYIEAIKACEIGVIPKAAVMNWVAASVENLQFWNKLLIAHLLGSLEREMDLLIEKPEERVARVLLRSPRLFQEIPLRHIANYLRMTPETLSRIRK
jgi:CRP-like cAMP-binding protein